MWLSSDSSSFVNCRAHCPTRVRVSPSAHFRIRGEIIIILRFERRVCRWESCRMHQFTGMWLNPNSRGSRLRIWQPWGCKSLHAHHFTATGFSGKSRPRRLKIAEPSGCKSRVADRRVVNREQQTGVRLKIEQPWECKSPHADQFGMSTGRAGRTCLLNSGLPEKGVWCESTAFRHSCARSSKRAYDAIQPLHQQVEWPIQVPPMRAGP